MGFPGLAFSSAAYSRPPVFRESVQMETIPTGSVNPLLKMLPNKIG
jgi:hypothetical protein